MPLLLLEEIGRIGVQMTNGELKIDVAPEEFRYFWRRVKERTSSSRSGIHYGHYKAAAHSDPRISLRRVAICWRWILPLSVTFPQCPVLLAPGHALGNHGWAQETLTTFS